MYGYITMLLHNMIHFRHFALAFIVYILYIWVYIRTIKPFMRTYLIPHLWVKIGVVVFLGIYRAYEVYDLIIMLNFQSNIHTYSSD